METVSYLDHIREIDRQILVNNQQYLPSLPTIQSLISTSNTILNNILASLGGTSGATRTVGSSPITGTGSVPGGTYTVVIFTNPATNTSSITINGVPLMVGGSKVFAVEQGDYLGAISYNCGTQTAYYEYII